MEFPLFLLAMIFAFVLVMSIHQQRARERKDRLRVLEEAIRSGALDPDTKRDVVEALSGRRFREPLSPAARLQWLFGLGWLGMFLGIGLMITDDRDCFQAGAVIAPLGFALATLPLAYREIEARRRA